MVFIQASTYNMLTLVGDRESVTTSATQACLLPEMFQPEGRGFVKVPEKVWFRKFWPAVTTYNYDPNIPLSSIVFDVMPLSRSYEQQHHSHTQTVMLRISFFSAGRCNLLLTLLQRFQTEAVTTTSTTTTNLGVFPFMKIQYGSIPCLEPKESSKSIETWWVSVDYLWSSSKPAMENPIGNNNPADANFHRGAAFLPQVRMSQTLAELFDTLSAEELHSDLAQASLKMLPCLCKAEGGISLLGMHAGRQESCLKPKERIPQRPATLFLKPVVVYDSL